MNKNIAVIAGDGIGPEIVAQAISIRMFLWAVVRSTPMACR